MTATLLKQLQDSQEFQVVMTDILKLRPIVPNYRPCDTDSNEQKLFNQIKFQSGAVEGFDKLWTALSGRKLNLNQQGEPYG